VKCLLPWLGSDVREFTVRPYDAGAFPVVDTTKAWPHRIAIVDTETLGTADADPVIEVAVQQFAYDREKRGIIGLVDEYVSFNDPGVPIPEEITALTGITSEMVAGHKIDAESLRTRITQSSLVIAHNAKFDRPKVEAITGPLTTPWACSCEMVDWRGHGLPSSSLAALCMAHGFYTTSHRALGDVTALAKLLTTTSAASGQTYFAELLDAARTPANRIFANDSPFESKDKLKSRGYRWDSNRRVWWLETPAANTDAECGWLAREVYAGGGRSIEVVKVDPRTRFAAERGGA
jgi:DNA polymerase-3 subunit epsilon